MNYLSLRKKFILYFVIIKNDISRVTNRMVSSLLFLKSNLIILFRATMEQTNFPITNWSEDDKPREKLMLKGKSALSDAELIAILIGSGSRNESAVGLSKRILASVDNNLNALGKLTIQQLMTFKGIGEAKAISIIASMELGRRRRAEDAIELKKITSSKMIFELMQPIIGELPHEEFWVL